MRDAIITVSARTIEDLVVRQGEALGKAPVLLASDRRALDYATLRIEVERMTSALAAAGIGRTTRVGLALPNVPEAVVSILSALCAGVCVPLNPGFGWNTCETLFRSLHVDALIALDGADVPAVLVARTLDLGVLRVVPAGNAAANSFMLRVEKAGTGVARSSASHDDLAIVFHTSGTTSTPKSVPLTQCQLLARSGGQPLVASDRCLLVPPIFTAGVFAHSLLSPLTCGAAIAFARDSSLDALLDALVDLQITCFSANPALLESLRERAERRPAAARSLRFIRSSAAALTSDQQDRIEAVFGVPVVQGYGMTEAGSIAQNPLPPVPRKPGSVGLSVGPDIAIVDSSGAFAESDVSTLR